MGENRHESIGLRYPCGVEFGGGGNHKWKEKMGACVDTYSGYFKRVTVTLNSPSVDLDGFHLNNTGDAENLEITNSGKFITWIKEWKCKY